LAFSSFSLHITSLVFLEFLLSLYSSISFHNFLTVSSSGTRKSQVRIFRYRAFKRTSETVIKPQNMLGSSNACFFKHSNVQNFHKNPNFVLEFRKRSCLHIKHFLNRCVVVRALSESNSSELFRIFAAHGTQPLQRSL